MSNNDESYKGCPIQHARQFLAGKWQMGILWNLKNRPLRFGEIKKLLPGLPDKTLMEELEFFVEKKIIERITSEIRLPRTEYALSVLGQSLLHIISATVEGGYLHLQEVTVDKEMRLTSLSVIRAIDDALTEK